MRGNGFWTAAASLLAAASLAVTAARAADVTLNSVFYPDEEKTFIAFDTTDRAPKAKVEAKVRPEAGQAWIDVDWSKLEPALLFGGDLTCWVLWAVTPDGVTENLGELPVRKDRSGSARFSTPHNNFAMMVTAEPLPIVRKPSDLVVFLARPSGSKLARNTPFPFGALRTGIKRDQESIATLKYKDKTPIELHQAHKAVEIMDRYEAEKYASKPAQDARVALGQADDAYAGRVGKASDVPDLARRATTLASEAVRAAVKQIDAQKAQEQEAKRLSEMAALEAQSETERKARMETEAALQDVQKKRQALEADMARLQTDKAKVEADREQIRRERDALAQRLSGALGAVSATERTGRGLVVSLSSGILFDVGKSKLKADAKVALSKLAGILLMIPDTNIEIEGHTDSTGSQEGNAKLSQERAAAVRDFLESQGVVAWRMAATRGLGSSQPVDSNDTSEGRSKNRRVEIVVPEGRATASTR